MSERLRLFILAGEPSGDRIAADLVQRLKSEVSLELTGVGGDELSAQGLRSLFPMSDLAVMGVTDVLLNLPLLLWRLEQTARAILAIQPDVVVLVDAQDFSRLLAQRLRKRGFSKPLILYVAPSVWARHPERAKALEPLFDAVLAVLPFEPAVMQQLGGPTTHYVGHPALKEQIHSPAARESGPLILLPGSRQGELRRHLPLFRSLASQLAAMPAVTELIIPTLPGLRKTLEQQVHVPSVPIRIVDNRAERQEIYACALAAICVSGTVTLELALARVPMAVVYALDGHQARIYQKLGSPSVSLPNIILKRSVVPEVVKASLEPGDIAPAIAELLQDKKARQRQINAFAELSSMMETGDPSFPKEDPAQRILAIWRSQRPLIAS